MLAHALVGGRVDRTAASVLATAPLPDRLRGWLRDRLPAHMVPEHVLTLDSWPLSANGKVDRRRLPAPRQTGPTIGYVAPRTPTERQLATLWCEVLDLPRVGVLDNFFDLGGHSLLLAEFRTVLAASLGHELTMVELFQHPTVGSLAEYLAVARPAGDPSANGARERAENRRQSRNRRQRAAERRALSREDR